MGYKKCLIFICLFLVSCSETRRKIPAAEISKMEKIVSSMKSQSITYIGIDGQVKYSNKPEGESDLLEHKKIEMIASLSELQVFPIHSCWFNEKYGKYFFEKLGNHYMHFSLDEKFSVNSDYPHIINRPWGAYIFYD